MFETTFSVEKNKAHLLSYIVGCVEPDLNEIDGIVTTASSDNRLYVSLACSDTYRYQVKRLAEKVAVDVLSIGYKNAFLHEKLGNSENIYHETLVNTMCAFDSDYDKRYIGKIVNADKPMYFDGYYNFLMADVKSKWQEVVDLVMENSAILYDKSMTADFLDYLTESVPTTAEISVTLDNDLTLYSCKGKVITPVKSLSPTSTVESEALLNIICLHPKKVKLYATNASSDFTDLLSELFVVETVETK